MATSTTQRKFGSLEIIFMIGLLVAGCFGLAYAFLLRAPEPVFVNDDNVTSPSMEVMALYQRILSEPDPAKPGTQMFMNRILAGHEWIHEADDIATPVKLNADSKLYWSCRASRNAIDRFDLRKDALPIHEYPKNQYQIAILLYRDYQPDAEQEPITYYTGVVNPTGGPTGLEKEKDENAEKNKPARNSDLPDPEADFIDRKKNKK